MTEPVSPCYISRTLERGSMKNKASVVSLIAVGLAVVLGCGRLTQQITNEAPTIGSDRSDTFSLKGKEWRPYELPRSDIKVELPGEPSDKSPSPAKLPPGYKEVFSGMSVHAYDGKEFGSSYSQLEPTGKRSFTIKELADTSMTALKRQAPDLNYTLDVTSDTKAKYNGTFTRNGKSFELKGCCIYQKTKPLRVWAVITVYPKDHADGKTASERIIDSVSFSGSSEECN
jgi:hypothetical protein